MTHPTFSLRRLLAIVAVVALPIAAIARLRRESLASQLASRQAFYDRVLQEQAGAGGRPLVTVVSSESGQPVGGVIVGLTLIGPDGGDGGFKAFLTDAEGIARRHIPLKPGRYQYHLQPSVDCSYDMTYWRRGMPYLTILPDGSTSTATLIIETKDG